MKFGWRPNPAVVEAILSRLAKPTFAEAAPHLKDSGAGKDVFLWAGEQKVLGKLLDAWNQTRGTCTSKGSGRCIQDTMLNQIALGASEEWEGEVATEPIYAGSRVEIDHQLSTNWRDEQQDGSTGAAVASWLMQYGVLVRKKYGSIDLTNPSDDLACQWTASRNGVPDELEPVAKQHPAKQIALVTSYNEARDSIASGHGVFVCSNQGFGRDNTINPRDANGFCKAEGTWAHCMYFRACVNVKGNQPGLVCQQSWHDQPPGPSLITLESGQQVQYPMGCFGVHADVADRMLQQRDSWAVSAVVGFPSQTPQPWYPWQ